MTPKLFNLMLSATICLGVHSVYAHENSTKFKTPNPPESRDGGDGGGNIDNSDTSGAGGIDGGTCAKKALQILSELEDTKEFNYKEVKDKFTNSVKWELRPVLTKEEKGKREIFAPLKLESGQTISDPKVAFRGEPGLVQLNSKSDLKEYCDSESFENDFVILHEIFRSVGIRDEVYDKSVTAMKGHRKKSRLMGLKPGTHDFAKFGAKDPDFLVQPKINNNPLYICPDNYTDSERKNEISVVESNGSYFLAVDGVPQNVPNRGTFSYFTKRCKTPLFGRDRVCTESRRIIDVTFEVYPDRAVLNLKSGNSAGSKDRFNGEIVCERFGIGQNYDRLNGTDILVEFNGKYYLPGARRGKDQFGYPARLPDYDSAGKIYYGRDPFTLENLTIDFNNPQNQIRVLNLAEIFKPHQNKTVVTQKIKSARCGEGTLENLPQPESLFWKAVIVDNRVMTLTNEDTGEELLYNIKNEGKLLTGQNKAKLNLLFYSNENFYLYDGGKESKSMVCIKNSPMTESPKTRSCLETPRLAELGTACKTTQNVHFKLVEGKDQRTAWMDEQTGILWYDETKAGFHGPATANCNQDFGGTLPSIDDYKTAINHGLMEILRDMSEKRYGYIGYYYWTSNVEGSRAYVYKTTYLAFELSDLNYVARLPGNDYMYIRYNCISRTQK